MGTLEFHDIVSIAEAKRRLSEHFKARPKSEKVLLSEAYGKVAFEDIISKIDVPPFDRASMDGYAVKAKDTFYADEDRPAQLKLKGDIRAGHDANLTITGGNAAGIATGAPMPKGANAVVMVEYTQRKGEIVEIYRPVVPGENIMAAGSDIMCGETVVRAGAIISPREIGVLAAIGTEQVHVFKGPTVGIISSGDEIVSPGNPLNFGSIYDVNAPAIAGAVRENGGIPIFFGIVKDDKGIILKMLREALFCDVVIISGGTSAGAGDLLYKVLGKLGRPGIIVHGISVKPGKPTIIGVSRKKPIFGLPGYPTSALIVFSILVAPILRELSGLRDESKKYVKARVAMRLFSSKGRFEYMLVNLVSGADGRYSAYPVLSGSGAITTLSEAEGYVKIPENTAMIPEGKEIEVTLLSSGIKPADLTIIGSHCVGIDVLLTVMGRRKAVHAKIINVGSSGGLSAAGSGESDISGTHLIDEKTKSYNVPFIKSLDISDKVFLIRGYDREQGLLASKDNPKGIRGISDLTGSSISFINRNPGSGTRVLFDLELKKLSRLKNVSLNELKSKIQGYEIEAKSHSAIAAAVASGRADAGLAIRTVAHQYGLTFIPVCKENFDFAVPKKKIEKPSVKDFIKALGSNEFKEELKKMPGLVPAKDAGKVIYPKD